MTVRMAFASFAQEVPPAGKLARDAFYWLDDFTSSNVSQAAGTGGSVSYTNIADNNRPGIAQLRVTAVADRAYINPIANNQVWFMRGPSGGAASLNPAVVEFALRVPIVEDATDRWSFRIGLQDTGTSAADAADGIYLESDLATHGDSNFRLCCASNSVRTKQDTGQAAIADEWQRWTIEIASDWSSVQAYLDGVAAGSPVTTNIPATGRTFGYGIQAVKALGANLRTVEVDYIEMWQTFANKRSLT